MGPGLIPHASAITINNNQLWHLMDRLVRIVFLVFLSCPSFYVLATWGKRVGENLLQLAMHVGNYPL